VVEVCRVPGVRRGPDGFGYLQVLVTGLHGVRRLLTRQKVRRGLDAATGAVLLGSSVRLATEHV
jgi:threonine/homoserine/homoserine lactone efflux protein